MVSTFQVWLSDENKTMFIHVNEEGGTLATCDYINNEIDYDETMQIENFSTEYLTKENDRFELYKYCVLEYVKRDSKRYGYKAKLTYDLLPAELQSELTPEYLEWHYENIGNDFETDGYELFLSDDYVEPDPEIMKAKSMLQYMDDEMKKTDVDNNEKLLEKFYDLNIVIGFGDKMVTFPNSAAIYTGLQDCLKYFIDQY
jgi:hypothetical protein